MPEAGGKGLFCLSVHAIINFMSKGRNTTLLTTRISDQLYAVIKEIAEYKGMTLSEFVREILESNVWKEFQYLPEK